MTRSQLLNGLILFGLTFTASSLAALEDFTYRFVLEDILSATTINQQTETNPANVAGIDEVLNIVRCTAEANGELHPQASFGIHARLALDSAGDSQTELREGWISLGNDTSPMLKIGRQKAAWGLGFVWSPTDYVNLSKNVLDPDDPVTGRDMMLFEYPWQINDDTDGSFTLIWLPDPGDDTDMGQEMKDALIAGRAYVYWKETEIALTASLGPENERNIGLALSREIFEFMVNLEVNLGNAPLKRYYYFTTDPNANPYYDVFENDTQVAAMLGVTRSIGENGFFRAELLFDGGGYTKNEMEGYRQLLELTAANPLVFQKVYAELLGQYTPGHMSQLYGYFAWDHTFADDWNASVSMLSAVQTFFAYVTPAITYTGIQDVDISAQIMIPAGNADDGEGALLPTHSVFSLWLTGYF
ncbi:hypothetical protein ACFL4W_03385 [Planctomycetota bacterium]